MNVSRVNPYHNFNAFSFSLTGINKSNLMRFVSLLVLTFFSFFKPAKAQDSSENSYHSYTTDSIIKNDSSDKTGYPFTIKEKSNEAYSKSKINIRISSDTTIKQLREQDDFWYVKSIEQIQKNKDRLQHDKKYRDSLQRLGLLAPDEPGFSKEQSNEAWYTQPWFINTIWTTIIALFVAAVFYFLMSKKIIFFSRNAVKISPPEIEEDLFNVNYDALLVTYDAQKNYRLAVRILYLQLLKILSEKNIISYQPQFTNTHYLMQLNGTKFYNPFFTVTRYYEYVWYGEFAIPQSLYEKIKTDFANMKNEVSND